MSDLRSALTFAICDELDSALSRIVHCANQLSDEQLWWRPRADMNSIANLILHLTGNVRQLIVINLTDGVDNRDRPAEFAARDILPKAELLGRLTETVIRAKAAFAAASVEDLCRSRQVNKFEWTGLQAVVRSVAHFRGHTQEIIHLTRDILGEMYQYAGPK
jgi:Protein of unknown function (DUF1572)